MTRGKWGLSEVETRQLSELGNNTSRHGERARLILLSAAGHSAVEVAEKLGVTIPTVYKWRRRFQEDGISGLKDRARPGQPRRLTAAQRHEIARVTRDDLPQQGSRRWTIRLLSRQLGVTQHQVRMVWQEHDLAKHVVSTRLSNQSGHASLRGLFIEPPLSALAIAIDPDGQGARELAVPPLVDSSPLRAIYARSPATRGGDLTDVVANLLTFVAAVRDVTPPKARLELVFSSGSVFSVADVVHNLGLTQGIQVSAWARADAWIDSVEAWLASGSLDAERSAVAQLSSDVVSYLEDSIERPFAWVRGHALVHELRDAAEGGSRPDSARSRGLSQPRAAH
jgi:transposase